jgi:hypothetical protein
VFGLTHRLIHEADALRNSGQKFQDIEVEVVDCREYRPPEINATIKFEQANWLEWKPKSACDVVIGDDVLCNLGVWQIPMFFQSLARGMKPGGLFVVRTTAIFSPHLMHPSRREVAIRLKHIKEEVEKRPKPVGLELINESSVYEIAWPMMHSEEFYDDRSLMFDLANWDNFVKEEFRSDTAFANRLRLPYNVRVTSLDYGQLKEMALPWFEIAQEEIAVHSVWESDINLKTLPAADEIAAGFRQYYRILVFRRASGG